jgi:ubiquinone/menaquinone biosynthesis C-methylase UbiE
MTAAIDVFRALADPTRLRIVSLLRKMELSVGELAQVLGQSQPRVSRHVKILCDAGVAERRREGSWVFLGPDKTERSRALFQAIDSLQGAVDLWTVADQARLIAVRADRTRAAERYFSSHAEEWDAIRSLHVPESAVEAAMLSALGDAPLGHLVDVGTGTGRMIELFGPRADVVTGIDRSPDMLRLARAKLNDVDAGRVTLRLGEIEALPLEAGSADTVVLHQVLHYLSAPEASIAEIGRIMAAGARLLIVDFAPHELEELRDDHAHARLGFSDEQIMQWFTAARIDCDLSSELVGRALTVKLWRGVKREDAFLKAVAA